MRVTSEMDRTWTDSALGNGTVKLEYVANDPRITTGQAEKIHLPGPCCQQFFNDWKKERDDAVKYCNLFTREKEVSDKLRDQVTQMKVTLDDVKKQLKTMKKARDQVPTTGDPPAITDDNRACSSTSNNNQDNGQRIQKEQLSKIKQLKKELEKKEQENEGLRENLNKAGSGDDRINSIRSKIQACIRQVRHNVSKLEEATGIEVESKQQSSSNNSKRLRRKLRDNRNCTGTDDCPKFGHVKGERYECEICSREERKGRYQCNEKKMGLHKSQMHRTAQPWKCRDCDFQDARKQNLDRHLLAIHNLERTDKKNMAQYEDMTGSTEEDEEEDKEEIQENDSTD